MRQSRKIMVFGKLVTVRAANVIRYLSGVTNVEELRKYHRSHHLLRENNCGRLTLKELTETFVLEPYQRDLFSRED